MTPAERKALKAKAHKLEPVVHIGAKGLTDEVMAEIDRALRAHELIKVRAGSMERDQRVAPFADRAPALELGRGRLVKAARPPALQDGMKIVG